MNKIITGVVVVLLIGAGAYALVRSNDGVSLTNPPEEGKAMVKLGETAIYKNTRFTPLKIVEDSRCPADVQCIQAGTVKIEMQIVSGMGTSTKTLKLGESVTTEAEKITFVSVIPEAKKAGVVIDKMMYRFSFEVEKLEVKPPVVVGECHVGGCSGQICSDEPGAISTCEWTERYACYQTAKCERQSSGKCGWTETPALKMCLQTAN